tara:strand:+ start:1154 stop:1735 length:582 start_codon:yes stop_codon:yes gene_type:complete
MYIEAFILAAGLSRRMAVGNKLLKKLNNKPLISNTIENYLNSDINEISIITGHDSIKIKKIAQSYKINSIHNKNFKMGILSSIKVCLKNINPITTGVIIALGDMPLVSNKDIKPLIKEFMMNNQKEICIPECYNKNGNPIIFPAKLLKKILVSVKNNEYDRGLKEIIEKYGYKNVKTTKAVLKDFDNINDFIN